MKIFLLLLMLSWSILPVSAQRNVQPFPREVRAAKTVAIVNRTHNEAVEQGALDALKRWGHYTVVDDSDTADIVLAFDKKSEHEGKSTQKTDPNGQANTSYGITFGSSVSMKATLKGTNDPFYTTSTGESKKKAGAACVTDLQGAFNSSH